MRRCGIWAARFKTGLCLAAVMAALPLVSCGQAPKGEEPEPVTLNLWYYWDVSANRKTFLRMVNGFNASQDEIRVEAKYVPDEDLKKTLALAVAEGTMPDLAVVDSSDVQYYDEMWKLAPLTDCVDKEQYLDRALASCTEEDGTLIGLPLGLNCLAFYYNTDLLAAAGVAPPSTLDEFADAARAVTSDTIYGCAFPSLQSEESMYCFLPILWAEGGSLTSVDSPASRRAFDLLRRLAQEGSMSRSSVNMTLLDISKEFAKGNIAMMFNISGRERGILDLNPDIHFEVAPVPSGQVRATVIGGEVLTVFDNTHLDAAKTFVRYIADPDTMGDYMDAMGYLAPRRDMLMQQMARNPGMAKYADILEGGRVREFTPYWPAISLAVVDVINQIILQEDSPDDISKLEQEIRTIREEYHEGR